MLTALTTLLVLGGVPAPCTASPGTAADDVLRELYESGVEFGHFLEDTHSRRDEWHERYADASVDAALLGRARSVRGSWRLLVVAEDWCGDSANTIPFVARLVEQVDGLDMRIVDSGLGRPLLWTHPTPDGRPATPTVLLLDASWNEKGCFIERPATLQTWFIENPDQLAPDALHEAKYAWYDQDGGTATLTQIVEMLEGAAAGTPVCR